MTGEGDIEAHVILLAAGLNKPMGILQGNHS